MRKEGLTYFISSNDIRPLRKEAAINIIIFRRSEGAIRLSGVELRIDVDCLLFQSDKLPAELPPPLRSFGLLPAIPPHLQAIVS